MEISDPERAAEHHFSMLRGMLQFRLIMSIEKEPSEQVMRRHVEDCVDMFLRVYKTGRASGQ
jgi:TetR/AcrR family transcriptional repressor of mexJK operon